MQNTPAAAVTAAVTVYTRQVREGEYVPADLVLLSSDNPEAVAYVDSMNLDGETNLKLKQGLPETSHLNSPVGASLVAQLPALMGPTWPLLGSRWSLVRAGMWLEPSTTPALGLPEVEMSLHALPGKEQCGTCRMLRMQRVPAANSAAGLCPCTSRLQVCVEAQKAVPGLLNVCACRCYGCLQLGKSINNETDPHTLTIAFALSAGRASAVSLRPIL